MYSLRDIYPNGINGLYPNDENIVSTREETVPDQTEQGVYSLSTDESGATSVVSTNDMFKYVIAFVVLIAVLICLGVVK